MSLIAQANAGWLVPKDYDRLMLEGAEQLYLSADARLMKEAVDREYRGGYSGVSFRVAKGVRVSSGGMRGKSVVTGSHIEVADEGSLFVTSTRVVFVGNRSTMEIPYAKLVSMEGFSDGVRFSMSNRVKAPLFTVPSGALIIATIEAAISASSD